MIPPHLKAEDIKRLSRLESNLRAQDKQFLGFPATLDFDYPELERFSEVFMNNVGDPRAASLSKHDTKEFEWEVVTFFADLFRAPADDYWGYVTSGGTEGNLYGLYLARELYPDAICYYSEAAHYSVPKNVHILGLPQELIATQPSGEIDYQDFRRQIRLHADRPAIIVANIGTTMTEAKDNVASLRQILSEEGVEDSFIHCDAALAGPYVALLEPHWPFDFVDGANSISVSGHKFIGSPVPCGVVITRETQREHITKLISYLACPDPTISGSRSGHAVLYLWSAIKKYGRRGFLERATAGIHLAEYTYEKLTILGWPTWHNPMTLTVQLQRPPEAIIRRWQLATSNDHSHIICMPGITRAQIDAFVDDLAQAAGIPQRPPAPATRPRPRPLPSAAYHRELSKWKH